MKSAVAIISVVSFLIACTPKAIPPDTAKKDLPPVPHYTYSADVSPLISRSCTPCHFPAQEGRKLPLDSYAAVKMHIGGVIRRVSLPQDDAEFMPFKMKKQALTPEEIQLLNDWVAGGFKE